MTLDDELQKLKRRTDESPNDVGSWAAYLSLMTRTGGAPDSLLEKKMTDYATMIKILLLARLRVMDACPNQQFEGGTTLPAVYVRTLETYPTGSDVLYLIKDKGLYVLIQDSTNLPALPNDEPDAIRNRECVPRCYLEYGFDALRAICLYTGHKLSVK